jgi:hypothetical protein
VIAFGKPTLRNYALSVPLVLRFNNSTPVPINIDRLYADIYVYRINQFVKGATLDQPVQIAPGTSTQTIFPQVNLDNLFGGDALQTTQFLSHILLKKEITIRVDYRPIFHGVALPLQSFTDTIPLT